MLLANMSLIPKINKNHTLHQNYRPISVINNDLKIFSRILADRLAGVISLLISPYQAGFIPQRLIIDNIRHALGLALGLIDNLAGGPMALTHTHWL